MFKVNDDLSIYVTRGDIVFFSVAAEENGGKYTFHAGDLVRLKVFAKKDCENVVLQKDFPVTEDTELVDIFLEEEDTKIGDVISKPTDYWYEVELNPFDNPQTIVGYDDDGAKVFKLFPEGDDLEEFEVTEEDIPVVDDALDMTSTRPVQNQAIASAVVTLNAAANANKKRNDILSGEIIVERARITNLASLKDGSTTGDAELMDGRVDSKGLIWSSIGNNIRASESMVDMLAETVGFVTEKITSPTIGGWVDDTGMYQPNAQTGDSNKCVQINVMPGERYLIYSEYGYRMPDAVAQKADGGMVKIFNTSPNAMAVNNFDKVITIPDGAAKLTVNYWHENGEPNAKPLTVAKVVGIREKVSEEYLANVLRPIRGGSGLTGENLIKSVKTAYGLKFGEEFAVESGDTQFSVGECEVEQGKTYVIKAGASFMSNPYLFYDKSGLLVGDLLVAPENGYKLYDLEVTAPSGATLLKVGNYGGKQPEVYEVVGYGQRKWAGLKWVCVGDSLTEVNSHTTKHYFDYITETTGISVVNMGVGGTGYKRGEENSIAFYQRIDDVPADADVVTIFGSGNDVSILSQLGRITDSGTDTICGCVNTTINKLYSINPAMQIGIISPTPWVNHQPSNNSGMGVYSTALKDICAMHGIPFLDLYRCSGFRPNDKAYRDLVFSKDSGNGVHPNELGHKIIASRIKAFLDSLIV